MARRLRRDDSPPSTAAEELAVAAVDMTNPGDARFIRSAVAVGRRSSSRAWKWYDEIGDVHYSAGRSARVAGFARLYVCQRNVDGTPGARIKGGMEADILSTLYSPYGGQRHFIERFVTLMKVPGDAYLVRCRTPDGNPDGYDWAGVAELKDSSFSTSSGKTRLFQPSGKIERIVLPDIESASGELVVPIEARDFLGRVWRPSGKHAFQPDSPLMAMDNTCELLDLLTRNIKAKLLSRFALNGVFFVPQEITNIQSAQPAKDGASAQTFHSNRVLDRLISACTWAVQNHESPEAAVPIFMTGPGNYGDMIKHITYDRQIYEVDMKLRAELLEKILRGLDSPPTAVTGSQDSNHWGAWASADEEIRVDAKPDLEMLSWALTRLVLRPEMIARGAAPAKVAKAMIWFDISAAQAKSNIAEDARQVSDRGGIGPSALRRLSGIDEADAPTEEEYIRLVGIKTGDPYLATYGLGEAANIDWTRVGSAKSGPNPDSPAPDAPTGPGVGNPGSPAGSKSDTKKRLRPN